MTIALTPSSQSHPTPVFQVQWNEQIVPGYCQALDDPLVARLRSNQSAYGDASAPEHLGAGERNVTLAMRVLTRLGTNSSGRARLDDCLEQYREALEIVTRTEAAGRLYVGDSDRYLPATFSSASAPLSAPDHQAITFNLTFRSASWYRGTSTVAVVRNYISDARLVGTTSGSVTFSGTSVFGATPMLLNAANESILLQSSGSLDTAAGSLAVWVRPSYSNTDAQQRVVVRVSGANNNWDFRWDGGREQYVAYRNGSFLVEPAPDFTFAVNDYIFLGITWGTAGTRIYSGKQGGSLSSGSNVTSVMSNLGTMQSFRIGSISGSGTNAQVSDLVTFGSELTATQMTHLFQADEAYDPFDTDLPTTMLLNHRLSTVNADSSSNGLYADLGNMRRSYPSVAILGGPITLSGINTGRHISYGADAVDIVTVDCATLAVTDTAGSNMTPNVNDVRYGISYQGSQRVGLATTSVSGTADVAMTITPRYER